MRRWFLLGIALLASAPSRAEEPDALFDAQGYRISHYRAPVTATVAGVRRIGLDAAAALRPDHDAIFVDVMPAEGGHREADGTWRLAKERPSIPGAHWFPEAGRGVLASDIGPWFEQGVSRLPHGRRDRMIVTFCLDDCWMSWKAAKRLHALGYTNVWWLAEGTDGWRDLGRPLAQATPEP